MKVIEISYDNAMKWCLLKHYAKRKPMYQFAYGLVISNKIEGIVVYGRPPVQIEKSILKKDINLNYKVYELTRLVIQTKKNNAASFLIGNSLKLLPKNNIVVSYADTNMNHCGIVYQSTNWLYTGGVVSHDCEYIINGKKMHPKSITQKYGITSISEWAKKNNIKKIKPKIKHRYFYINADKRTKKIILKNFNYKIEKQYPKCNQNRYNDGAKIIMYNHYNNDDQLKLF